jgi:hypothetical protein
MLPLCMFTITMVSNVGKKQTDEITVEELAEFDVVLTTYNVIAKEIHYMGATPKRSLRHEKRFYRRGHHSFASHGGVYVWMKLR